jgi:precorrin-6B methylase 2
MNGAIYFPTSARNIETAVLLSGAGPGQKVADLGSGDGKILIAFARAGVQATGFEINPHLVRSSRKAIKRLGLESLAIVEWKSIWKADLSGFDAVYVYGIPYIMKKLGKKIRREMKPGSRVISNVFPFPDWQYKGRDRDMFLYIIG